jgi:hypothetical protein
MGQLKRLLFKTFFCLDSLKEGTVKTNRFVFVVSLVLSAIILVACGIAPAQPTSTPIPTVTAPTVTPQPTATPWGVDVVQFLLANGFKEDTDTDCVPQPCKYYINNFNRVTVTVFDNGIRFSFRDDENITSSAATIDRIIILFYGREVDTWIADNLQTARLAAKTNDDGGGKSGNISDTVNGFLINVKYYHSFNSSTDFYYITVSPGE